MSYLHGRICTARARQIQERLKNKVSTRDDLPRLRYVAGVDVSYSRQNSRAKAAWVVLELPGLNQVDQALANCSINFPYIPGFLSFRELPPLLQAYSKLSLQPDLVVCDGQGTAHPQGFGLACHLGVTLDLPCLGAAKSRLTGEFVQPGLLRGDWSPLVYQGQTIGAALRTKDHIRPLFVSPGHRISLESSLELVLRLCTGYKLPETTRTAHALCK